MKNISVKLKRLVRRWNTRPIEDALRTRIEELEQALEKASFIQFENEDELPEMDDAVYNAMFECSHVDFVRLFPYVEENEEKYYLTKPIGSGWVDINNRLPYDAHLPRIDQTVQIVADGKVMQATFDYYCPTSSEERVYTWEIYRESGRVVYLPREVNVTHWRPLPPAPMDEEG